METVGELSESFGEFLMTKSLSYYLIIVFLATVTLIIDQVILPRKDFLFILFADWLKGSIDFKDTLYTQNRKSNIHDVEYWQGKINGIKYIDEVIDSKLKTAFRERDKHTELTKKFRQIFRQNNKDLLLTLKFTEDSVEFAGAKAQVLFKMSNKTKEENLSTSNLNDFLKSYGKFKALKYESNYDITVPVGGEVSIVVQKTLKDLRSEEEKLDRQTKILSLFNRFNILINGLVAFSVIFLGEFVQDFLSEIYATNLESKPLLNQIVFGELAQTIDLIRSMWF